MNYRVIIILFRYSRIYNINIIKNNTIVVREIKIQNCINYIFTKKYIIYRVQLIQNIIIIYYVP